MEGVVSLLGFLPGFSAVVRGLARHYSLAKATMQFDDDDATFARQLQAQEGLATARATIDSLSLLGEDRDRANGSSSSRGGARGGRGVERDGGAVGEYAGERRLGGRVRTDSREDHPPHGNRLSSSSSVAAAGVGAPALHSHGSRVGSSRGDRRPSYGENNQRHQQAARNRMNMRMNMFTSSLGVEQSGTNGAAAGATGVTKLTCILVTITAVPQVRVQYFCLTFFTCPGPSYQYSGTLSNTSTTCVAS